MDRLDPTEAIEHWKAKNLDLSALLHMPDVPDTVATYQCQEQDHGLEKALDHRIIEATRAAVEGKEPVRLAIEIANSNRAVGMMLSYAVSKRYGLDGLPEDTVSINLKGSAGQSFGVFLSKGITMTLEGRRE